MNVRAAAMRVMLSVIEDGCSLTDALAQLNIKWKDPRDAALLQAICYGVCRWYFRLESIAQSLLKTPFKAKDTDVYLLLLIGLYQLIDMRMPSYAVVNETVNATKHLKKPWARGLMNGVLREYLRQISPLPQAGEVGARSATGEGFAGRNLSGESQTKDPHPPCKERTSTSPACGRGEIDFYSHPRWIIEKVKRDFPTQWQSILTANNQHPPFSLRVNQQKISRENYLAKLAEIHIEAHVMTETRSGILLENAIDVHELPNFSMGDVSIQDGAAQLAAELLELAPQQRVLDACAAPGGKTAHMLEWEPTLDCVAVDYSAERLVRVSENLQRVHLSATCIHADVADTQAWWDGKLFDRILLDAPCSASGVIRRHPDIKLLRRASDIATLAQTQLAMLTVVWPLLKPGGLLVYATCSIFSEENQYVIQNFLKNQPDAVEKKIHSSWGIECSIGKQILPGMQSMDGFYFACLRK